MIRLTLDSKFPETIHLTSLEERHEVGAADWKLVFCCLLLGVLLVEWGGGGGGGSSVQVASPQ